MEKKLSEAREMQAELDAMDEATESALSILLHQYNRAVDLGLMESAPGAATHLWVVPGDDEDEGGPAPGTPPQTLSAAGAPGPEGPTATAADTPAPDTPVSKEVVVRGRRMQEILTVVGSRPDANWLSSDVADLLGVAKEDRSGRRAVRSNLRSLVDRGALERVTSDSGTYYRARMNWRFI
ncbi:hypothetical protein ACFYXF_11240 [Streptomyces sp. NPDC002680]|uniref:hypothetical protein n=1 Tax=Streptomyces sp. NPDC002680 TaxID=3364659 RepID=UPI0036782D02